MQNNIAVVRRILFQLFKKNGDNGSATSSSMNDGKWLVVYTRPGVEKKVAALFQKKGGKSYCPMNTHYQQIGDKIKIVTIPLFSRNVFVYVEKENFSKIRGVNGAINFVYWLGKPVMVKNEEIEAVRKLLIEYPHVNLEKIAVNLKTQSDLISDPVILRKGNLLSMRNTTFKIILPSLGQVLVAATKKENFERSRYAKGLRQAL